MNHNDLNGVILSTPHSLARDAYNRASTLFHGYYGDPLGTIDRALCAHPDFLMGHALKAGMLLSTTDIRLYPLVAQTLDAAERHIGSGDVRAKGHLAAARALQAGDWNRAAALYGEVLREFPRDVLALQMAHLTDHLMGNFVAMRDRPTAMLAHLTTFEPGYGFVKGMQAFGLEESGEYDAAEAAGQDALSHNRRDPWAIHAVAHVYEMRGQISDGIRWLERYREDWLTDSAFASHNAWHLALFWLELDQSDKALVLYDELLQPRGNDTVLKLIDATALLWRLHLRDIDVGRRWRPLLDQWRSRIDDRIRVFNDLHALLALLATNELTLARKFVNSIEAHVRGCGAQAIRARTAAVHVSRGLLAFAEKRYAEALPYLVRGQEIAEDFGGSHVQRDLVALTTLRSAELAGASDMAAALLQKRLDSRPDSPFLWSSLAAWRKRNETACTAETARQLADKARITCMQQVSRPIAEVT